MKIRVAYLRRLVWLLSAVLIALVATWLFHGAVPAGTHANLPEASVAHDVEAPPKIEVTPATVRSGPGPSRSAEVGDAPPAKDPPADGLIPLEIEVIAVDHQGQLYPSEDGVIVVSFSRGPEGLETARWDSGQTDLLTGIGYLASNSLGRAVPIEELSVSKGRAKVRVSAGAHVKLFGGTLRGLNVQASTPVGWARLPTGQPLRVMATWPLPILLDVRDRADGARLQHVDVLVPGDGEWLPHHVDSATVLVGDKTSPVVIPPEMLSVAPGWSQQLFVQAPGYAMRAISVYAGGGETLVTLESGGDIEVFVDGDLGEVLAMVRVWSTRGRHRALDSQARVPESRRVVFAGVPAGPVTVGVEIGECWGPSRHVLGTGSVEVRAGQTTEIRVGVPPQPVVGPVPFRGVVWIPAEWPASPFSMIAALREPSLTSHGNRELKLGLTRRSPTSNEWEFDAGLVEPGRYAVRVDPVHVGALFEVPPEGTAKAWIGVPSPASVLVRVRDAATSEPVGLDRVRVFWTLAGDFDRVPGARLQSAGSIETAISGVRLVAPATEIEVDVRAEGYGDRRQHVRLVPGQNPDLVVLLHAVSSLRVSMHDGARVIPASSFVGWLIPLEGQRGAGLSTQASWAAFVDVEFGRYRLEFGEHPDYAPIEPREVVVGREPGDEVVIDVKRRW